MINLELLTCWNLESLPNGYWTFGTNGGPRSCWPTAQRHTPSSTLHEHHLVAFWVPLLHLHLAGPDNITAYSLEDNKLWKRHLLTLVVQVLGAGYVLYKHISSSDSGILFWLVTILMTAVAAAKFCERTWALRCANFSTIRGFTEAGAKHKGTCHFYLEKKPPKGGFKGRVVDKEEFLMLRAHAVFRICKFAMVDSSNNPGSYVVGILKYLKENEIGYMWMMMEMELSLMYGILYTKAALIHTLPGYCIRIVSPLVVVTCFLLFHFNGGEGLGSADVVITYVLLGSAFFMEMTSLLSALWSTWTFSFLCATQWSSLRHGALCLKRLARMLGFNIRRTVAVPQGLKDLVVSYIQHMIEKRHFNSLGVVRDKWGTEALQRWEKDHGVAIDRAFLGAELHEGIIDWHIATDIFLAQRKMNKAKDKHDLVKEVQTLSNHMMFLLVKRPDMLPGLAQNKLYQWTKKSLATEWSKATGSKKDFRAQLH
ncbi:hypothetical protein QOZ80_4BG0358750 [Eleusine coracana subsp. coracana]|nr:hypothetical protein QOZ80_4BG0358750 [Eleusine coracana subsp. coracana]